MSKDRWTHPVDVVGEEMGGQKAAEVAEDGRWGPEWVAVLLVEQDST